MLDVKTLGAVGDGVADDTIALQQCVNTSDWVYLSPGSYRITSPIVINRPIKFVGVGFSSSIITDFPTLNHAIILDYSQFSNYKNMGRYQDFRIYGSLNMGAGIFINLDTPAKFINRHVFDSLYVENGSQAAIYLNNPYNVDGFFCSRISNCLLYGGLYLARCGDSVTIENNTLTGSYNGVYATFVPGAANFSVRENNITASGLTIYIEGGFNTSIENNQTEHLTGSETYTNLIINSTNTRITGNNFNTHNTCTGANIALVNSSNTSLSHNNFTSQSTNIALYITPTSSNTIIYPDNLFNNMNVTNQGNSTRYI